MSSGESCSVEEATTDEIAQSDIESTGSIHIKQEAPVQQAMEEEMVTEPQTQLQTAPQCLQTEMLLVSLRNTLINGNCENSADFSFFQSVFNMIDKHNHLLKDFINAQNSVSNKIQECKKLTKNTEYHIVH